MEPSSHATILEKKQLLEEDLRRVEKQIYELEGEYLQETVKDGNILRGWDGYLGKGASSGAIRRINRFREADRMFSASSVTSGQASTFNKQADSKVCAAAGVPPSARPPSFFPANFSGCTHPLCGRALPAAPLEERAQARK